MLKKRVLLIVEPLFHQNHVGVQRVVRYHWRKLIEAGHFVTLATPINGKLVRASSTDILILMDERGEDFVLPTPTWAAPMSFPESLPEAHWSHKFEPERLIWQESCAINIDEFDESIITTPWLCATFKGLPEGKYSIGIVYDLVPTLLTLGVLRMPKFTNVVEFAHEHAVGFDFYIRNAKKISCISESTKQDFLRVYGKHLEQKTDVCLPFDDFGANREDTEDDAESVLLINVLDHRKNFAVVAKVLREVSKKTRTRVTIVGRERIGFAEVRKFLTRLSETCVSVEWYRSPSDAQVEFLMKKSKVLFFPSLYEGLGLPILEAQAKGLPVISSNNSSCGEINLNPNLTADALDHEAFASRLTDVLGGHPQILKGAQLRRKQLEFIANRNCFTFN